MQLAAIVTVLLRIIALKTTLDALAMLITGVGHYSRVAPGQPLFWAGPIVGFLGMLAACRLLWVYSERLSQRICGGISSSVSTGNLDLEDLYCVSMVFVGLWLFASAVPPVLSYTHFCVVARFSSPLEEATHQRAVYDLWRHAAQAVIGFGLIAGGRKWSKKIAGFHQRRKDDAPNQAMEGTAR